MKCLILALTLQVIFISQPWCARPLFTDDYGTVDPGKYELEVGYASMLNNDLSVSNYGCVSLKRGLLPGIDLGIELPFAFSSPLGMTDPIIHAKYLIAKLADDEGITARADIKLAGRDENEGYGTGDTDYGLFLIYSRKIGVFNTHFNFGHTFVCITKGEKEDEEDDVTAVSAAVEYPLFGELGDVAAELALANAPYSKTGFAQVGARYYVGIARLDVGYSFGLNEASIKNNISAGMTFEF